MKNKPPLLDILKSVLLDELETTNIVRSIKNQTPMKSQQPLRWGSKLKLSLNFLPKF